MVNILPKPRKRLTQAEALEQARARLQEEESSPKPRRARAEDNTGPRDRERWITLPKHLAMYPGEIGVIDQGWIWSHRIDRRAARTDANGVKHTPVRVVCLGPVDALNPNFKHENKRPGQRNAKGVKTSQFVLGSDATCTDDRLSSGKGFLAPPFNSDQGRFGGRPKKDGHDDLILRLTKEGLGCKAIARVLRRDGVSLSPSTICRRLEKIRGGVASQ
jgi:hypothetical protein